MGGDISCALPQKTKLQSRFKSFIVEQERVII
jgi:hypothetical protein